MTVGPERLQKVKESKLTDALDSIILKKPAFFYSKIDTKFDDGSRTVNFKTSVRLRADSAFNALITYAKIPVVTAMVTTDSIKISNKKDRCYVLENLEYFKNTFGINFKYQNIEEIILGLPLDYNTDEKYYHMHDPYNYIISSHRKRVIKRSERGKIQGDIIIKYFLSKDLQNVKRLEIESIEDSTTIYIDYLSRQIEKGYSIPLTMRVEIKTPNKVMRLDLVYDRAEINEPKELFIVIPESYEKCK
jgi:hypothetical protein